MAKASAPSSLAMAAVRSSSTPYRKCQEQQRPRRHVNESGANFFRV